MMFAWFNLLATPQKIAVVLGSALVLLAAIAGIVAMSNHKTDKLVQAAGEGGAAKAVAAGHETTLKQVGDAHEAATEIRNDAGLAVYCECLRSATDTTAGNCQRFLVTKPLPGGRPDPGEYCPRR